MSDSAQETLNRGLYLSAASLDIEGVKRWLRNGADAKYQSSRSLVFCVGLGALTCAELLLPHSDLEEATQLFLQDEVGFEPEPVAPTLDWFGQHLPPLLQEKWVEKYGEFCPNTKALCEKRQFTESLPTTTMLPTALRL